MGNVYSCNMNNSLIESKIVVVLILCLLKLHRALRQFLLPMLESHIPNNGDDFLSFHFQLGFARA